MFDHVPYFRSFVELDVRVPSKQIENVQSHHYVMVLYILQNKANKGHFHHIIINLICSEGEHIKLNSMNKNVLRLIPD